MRRFPTKEDQPYKVLEIRRLPGFAYQAYFFSRAELSELGSCELLMVACDGWHLYPGDNFPPTDPPIAGVFNGDRVIEDILDAQCEYIYETCFENLTLQKLDGSAHTEEEVRVEIESFCADKGLDEELTQRAIAQALEALKGE